MNGYDRREVNEARTRRRRKSKIKSVVILIESALIIVLAACLAVVSVKYNTLKVSDGNSSVVQPSSDAQGSAADGTASDAAGNTSSGMTDEQLALVKETEQWYLKLANPDNSVDNDFIKNVDLAKIESRFSSGAESSKYFDSRAVSYLNEMCKAALDDGVRLISVSSYRTYAYQQALYNNRVKRCINEGYGEAEAKKVAATIVALPGTSEHHLGLAVDINSVEESFENTAAFRWLSKNAENYGFILRYPKDKQSITKIIYEPWHYRYVGVEHAKRMNSLGMCFEEYIEYLKNGGVK